MSPRSALALLFLIAALAAGATACNGGQPIDLGTPGGSSSSYDSSFSNGAFDALADEDCGSASCHSAGGQASTGDLQLPDAAGVMTSSLAFTEITVQAPAVISTGSPATSTLLTKGAGTGHVGGALWDTNDDSYIAVLAWITSGAQFN